MKTENRNKDIFVAIDALTRWPEARAIKNKTAHEIVKFILKGILSRRRAPEIGKRSG